MIFLLVAAALVAGAPLVAAVLVSVASLREDAAKSLAGRPPGLFTATARRLLQACVGDAGPVRRPHLIPVRLPRVRVLRQPRRARKASQVLVPVPRLPAEGDDAARSHGALATPRG